jgi:uncharacterized protein YkwD
MRICLLFLGLSRMMSELACAEESAPPGITWQGSVSLGTELDEHALPSEESPPPEKPARIRIGFSAKWSFSLHWERVEPKSDDENFDAKELSTEESKLIELANAERKKLKLPALEPDPVLMKLARMHAAAMGRLDRIGHELDGKTFSQRMEQAKYQASRAGENVAEGQRTPAEAIVGWMQSPGHKGNILHPDYTKIGVGLATGKSGKMYWTQVFAKPFDAAK